MAAIPEWYRSPFEILNDLGIIEPDDIDIEAIAEDCGATIRYQQLSGCAARIMGYPGHHHHRGEHAAPAAEVFCRARTGPLKLNRTTPILNKLSFDKRPSRGMRYSGMRSNLVKVLCVLRMGR